MQPAGRAQLTVAVVEDQPSIRNGLHALIDGTAGCRCSGAFETVEDALCEFSSAEPDIALVDIGLPGMSGIEGTRILKQTHPRIQVVVLTVYDDDDRIFQALCAGAVGYLLKNTPPARLLECLREVAAGGAAVSPEIARRVITLFQRVRPSEADDSQLTPHETRILKLLVDGHNYRTAAAELEVSVHAVSFHVRKIYDKLQVHSRSEAVAKALRSNLIR